MAASNNTSKNLVLVNPSTGREYNTVSAKVERVSPKMETALRAYFCGQVATQEAAAKLAGVSFSRFNLVVNSPPGQKLVNELRGQMDLHYSTLQKKFIRVVEDALDHPDPAVALAGANLYAKTQIGTKVNVNLSAEDIVQQIMAGTYQGE